MLPCHLPHLQQQDTQDTQDYGLDRRRYVALTHTLKAPWLIHHITLMVQHSGLDSLETQSGNRSVLELVRSSTGCAMVALLRAVPKHTGSLLLAAISWLQCAGAV